LIDDPDVMPKSFGAKIQVNQSLFSSSAAIGQLVSRALHSLSFFLLLFVEIYIYFLKVNYFFEIKNKSKNIF
jgi:hypothetical protein